MAKIIIDKGLVTYMLKVIFTALGTNMTNEELNKFLEEVGYKELPKGHGRLIDADEYQKKINSVFPCKDKDDTNIRRATELGLMSVSTIIEADKESEDEE